MPLQLLIDRPEFFPVVARWNWEQWRTLLFQHSAAEFEDWLRLNLRRDALPTTLLAIEAGAPIGTVSVMADDMETRPELGPWLASLYVVPAQRGRGLGRQLVQAAVDEASRLGWKTLYLYTPGHEEFYEALGWHRCERVEFRGEIVTIMQRSLPARSTRGED